MTFWLILAAMTAATLAIIALPFLSRSETERRGGDVAIYRDQLAEIERDRAADQIGEDEAEASRIEVSRRLLKAAATERTAALQIGAGSRHTRTAALGLSLVAAPVLAAGLYYRLGSPAETIPKPPVEARGKGSSGMSLAEMIARVEAHIQSNPDDGRSYEVLAPVYMRIGRFDDAVAAWRKAIELSGDSAMRESGLAEALIGAADGVVTKEAKGALDQALKLDKDSVPARYYLGVAAMQDGRRDDARKIWSDMLAGAAADAPWTEPVRRALAALDDRPAAAEGPGPSREQVEAAGQMTKEQRTDMIRSMVSRLADKLKQDGADPDGWARLVRAYRVLGENDKAEQAVADARKALSADADKLRRFEDAAKDAGGAQQ